jgi:hypothetical protein
MIFAICPVVSHIQALLSTSKPATTIENNVYTASSNHQNGDQNGSIYSNLYAATSDIFLVK